MAAARTPPEQKWLLNERAAVAGELRAIETELSRLSNRKKRLTQMLASIDNVFCQVVRVPTVPPLVVRAHTRYGGRGNCINWVREVLRAAYPSSLDTTALTMAAEKAFELSHTTAAQRHKFMNNSLRSALRTLRDRGEIERLHDCPDVPHRAGVWRWVVQDASYAAIVVEAREQGQKQEHA